MNSEMAPLQSAFDKGRHAATIGKTLADNPFRPSTDEEQYLCWRIAFAEQKAATETGLTA